MSAAIVNNSLIIEASAGSGKTYQLITRLVQLLLGGANPAHIVAITFTRKAAAEMSVRLQERLYDLATSADATLASELNTILGSPPTPSQIIKARCLYEDVIFSPQTVRCTTFHSFCQDILKRFPFEAEVPPGFELSEQTSIYRQQAWQALMAECNQKDNPNTSKAITFLFEEFGLNNTRDILKSFLDQRSDWWAWTQHAGNPLGFAISRMQDCLNVNPDADPLADFFNWPGLETTLAQFCSCLEKLKADKFKKLLDLLSYVRDTSLQHTVRLNYMHTAFLTDKGEPRSFKATKEMSKIFGETEAEDFVQIHLQICSKLESLNNDLNLLNNYKINKHWYIAGEAFLNHYQTIKFSLRQLDFTDLEWQTYCLLTKSQHALWIQYKLDSRINHLLIDEFQDTNPIQWRLLQPLIEEFSQQPENESDANASRSVLLVGDTKQSIYRFRRAEPKLFPIASNFIAQQFNSERMQLNASWRSSPAIINFVNKIFHETSLGRVIEDFPEHQTELTTLPGSVTLLDYPLILKDDAPENTKVTGLGNTFRNPLLQSRAEKQSEHQREAQNIADKIVTLIKNKQPVTLNGKTRAMQYQDIIILLRNRTNAAHYEKSLHQLHIPFVGSERGTLLECLEVSDIIMLLNWLITPFNNVALISILRSPLFSVSDQTLIQLAQIHSKEVGNTNWFNKIEIFLSQQSDITDNNLNHALTLLKRWQTIAIQIPVHDLLDVIYSEADVLAQYQRAFPAHLKSRTHTNLTRLIELALEVDSGRYPSLQQFIAHIERIKNSADEAPDTPAASNDKNRVQIMTIHASKGLEAPVIFLANADAEGKPRYTYKTIIDWPAEQQTPNMMLLSNTSRCRDSVTAAFIQQDSLAQQRETANLFYVAITRARQYLYISAAKPTKENSDWYTLIQRCYGMDATEANETVLETHLISADYQASSETASDTEKSEFTALIDPNLKKTITIKPAYQDMQKSVSPSSLSSRKIMEQSPLSTQNVLEYKSDTFVNTDTDVTNRGIVIHSILETISNTTNISKSQCQNKLGQDLTEQRWNQYWDEAVRVLAEDKFAMFFSAKAQAYNEVSISYLDNGATVYGIIDRIIISDNKVHIIDYKTHQSVNTKNILEYAEYYRPQLMHYQKAAQLIWPGHSIQSYLLFTNPCLLHEYTPAPALQLQLI